MQHTATHQLSQWEKSDRILMEDFNGDNAKLEAALNTLAAADASEQQARAAADAAEQQARTAADAAEQQARTAQDTAIRQEFAAADASLLQQINSVSAAVPLVKLLDVSLAGDTARWDISVAGLNLTQYAEILAYPRFLSLSDRVNMRFNNRTDLTFLREGYPASNKFDYCASVFATGGEGNGLLRFYFNQTPIYTLNSQTAFTTAGIYHDDDVFWGNMDPAAIQTLNFATDNATILQAGSRLILWGLRM